MPRVRVIAGVGPSNANEYDDSIDNALRVAVSTGKVQAIGACGLGFEEHVDEIDEGSFKIQEIAFRRQIAIARDFDLPLVVQAKSAHDLSLGILKEETFPLSCVMAHSFDGSDDELSAWANNGAYISFGGWSADDPLKLIRQAKLIPADRILVESGAPSETIDKLAGFPARADQVVFVADALISLIPAAQLMANAETFFRANVNVK